MENQSKINQLKYQKMTGNELKKKLYSLGYNMSEIANLLGWSNQRFFAALGAADIKTGLIEDLARVTGQPLSVFYGGHSDSVVINGDGNVNNQVNKMSERYIALLEKKDEQIDRLITLLEGKSR